MTPETPKTRYELGFAEYPLRGYEKILARREVRGLLPDAKFIAAAKGRMLVESADGGAADKLKRLAFFAWFRRADGGARTPTAQREIEAGDGCGGGRNIRYFMHSLHEYKGRFYPQLGKALLNASGAARGDAVLDPFCGCGTLLLEAALAGLPAAGVDANPIGHLIARAKTASLRLSGDEIDRMRRGFADGALFRRGAAMRPGPAPPTRDMEYLRRWFPAGNLRTLLAIDELIDASFSGESRLVLKAALSAIAARFSYQAAGEQRIRRRKDEPPENVREFFCAHLRRHLDKIAALRRARIAARPAPISVHLGDARRLPFADNSVDVVVTSPPYATALPYIDADRLSLFLLGFADRKKITALGRQMIGDREIGGGERARWEEKIAAPKDLRLPAEIIAAIDEIRRRNARAQVGFRRRNTAALLCRYFIGMQKSLGEIRRTLKPGGRAALIVGDNFTVAGGVRVDIPTARFINLIAAQSGLRRCETIPMQTPAAYNIYSKNAMKRETITTFTRP